MDFFLSSLQKRFSIFVKNNFITLLINNRQKRLKADTIVKYVISNAGQVILKKQTMKAVNKNLKTKNKNFKNIIV